MNHINAKDWELLSFFEVEPERRDPSLPWLYDDSTYVIQDGELSLSCNIHPSYKDIKLVLKHREHCLYEFTATGVDDIQVLKERSGEVLEITVSEQHHIWIKRHPSIEICQKC